MDSTPADVAKSEAARQLVTLAFVIITMLVVTAATDPDFLRTLRMRLALLSSRLLAFLARKAGHASMGIELQTGRQKYSLPFALSRLRDKANHVYSNETEGGCDACQGNNGSPSP